jgi:hypothetical protein
MIAVSAAAPVTTANLPAAAQTQPGHPRGRVFSQR